MTDEQRLQKQLDQQNIKIEVMVQGDAVNFPVSKPYRKENCIIRLPFSYMRVRWFESFFLHFYAVLLRADKFSSVSE